MSVTNTLQGRALSPHCPGQGQEQRGGSGATRTWGCSSGTKAGQGCECVSCRFVHPFLPAFLSCCPGVRSQHCLHPISQRSPGIAAWHGELPLQSPRQSSHPPTHHAQILCHGHCRDRDPSGCKSLKFFHFCPHGGNVSSCSVLQQARDVLLTVALGTNPCR